MKRDSIIRAVIILFIGIIIYFFGIKPYLSGDAFFNRDRSVLNWARNALSGNKDIYDVIVYGEEPDGIAAAISSARLGARTLLVSNGKDVGGVVEDCLIPKLDLPAAANGKMLNGGILAELNHKLGKSFTTQSYIYVVDEFIKKEKKLKVIYGAELISAEKADNLVKSISLKSGGKQLNVSGRVFIDASTDGDLLAACNVHYFKGSEDLNLKNSYMPVRLNFEMTGENPYIIVSEFEKDKAAFLSSLKGFIVSDLKTRINNFDIVATGDNSLVIQGLELYGIDAGNSESLKAAYKIAVNEARGLSSYMSGKLEKFKGWKFGKAAASLYIPEYRHFKGLYTLTVSDVLENRFSDSTIAMGSTYVDGGKLINGNIQIIGKPFQYGIPLGCIIPQNVDNLLMTGAKVSYSSLASSSAGNLATGIATGEAAGVVSVYSISKGATPADIEKSKKSDYYSDIQKYLKKQSFYMPDIKLENANEANWSYTAARQLLSLGLVAGGYGNNLGFDRKAKEQDLSILLLNGIYRANPGKYSLELDARLRPHFTDKPLTKAGAGAVIAALYNITGKDLYAEACSQGYINSIVQLRLKDKNTLTMDEVYYLAAFNIMNYTGMDISKLTGTSD